MTTSTDEQLTDRPGTAEDALVRAVMTRGLPLDQEVTVVAVGTSRGSARCARSRAAGA